MISADGRDYRKRVNDAVLEQRARSLGSDRLRLRITCFPPDRRRRDLDNLLKSLLDAMGKAGIYDDDGQIDDLHLVRGEPTSGGLLIVEIATHG